VLAGVGVLPRVELAAAAGLDVEDGVLVDDRQATSAAGVFAAGDIARPRGEARVEHWHAARESGERAGLAMAGADVTARRAPWIFSEFAGAKLDVMGGLAGGEEEVAVGPGIRAWVRGGSVVQLAVLDGAMAPDLGRDLVERAVKVDEIPR
jgi:hypothetical protein